MTFAENEHTEFKKSTGELKDGENYVKNKMNWQVELGADMKRHEVPEIPLPALREAIVNSFAHRNFNDPKGNEIAVFSDRIEIFNPGTFPEGLTPDDFIKGREKRQQKKRRIGDRCYHVGLYPRNPGVERKIQPPPKNTEKRHPRQRRNKNEGFGIGPGEFKNGEIASSGKTVSSCFHR